MAPRKDANLPPAYPLLGYASLDMQARLSLAFVLTGSFSLESRRPQVGGRKHFGIEQRVAKTVIMPSILWLAQ